MNHTPPSLDAIQRTADWLAPRIIRTPTVPYYGRKLEDFFGNTDGIRLKLELFQKTGSFKPRGALNVIRHLSPEQKTRGVTAFSAGNHAIATAYAAALSDVSAKVVMPKTANAYRIEQCRKYGADIVFADGMNALLSAVEELERSEGRAMIHPFEGELTTQGTATVGLELAQDAGDLDAVIVPIGGGGLISGIASAMQKLQPDCKVIGVEPEAACGMTDSLDSGAPLDQVTVNSIADSLSAPMHKPYSFSVIQQTVSEVVRVSDDELRAAMRLMFEDLKLAVEPAGAAAIAALIGPLRQTLAEKRVGIVVCGANIDIETFGHLIGGD